MLLLGKRRHHIFSAIFHRILFILAGKDDIHEGLDEFEILADPTLISMATDRVVMEKTVLPLFLGCFLSNSFHTCR